jgi:hypothetical protein
VHVSRLNKKVGGGGGIKKKNGREEEEEEEKKSRYGARRLLTVLLSTSSYLEKGLIVRRWGGGVKFYLRALLIGPSVYPLGFDVTYFLLQCVALGFSRDKARAEMISRAN